MSRRAVVPMETAGSSALARLIEAAPSGKRRTGERMPGSAALTIHPSSAQALNQQGLNQRALALWPRLDRRILARCAGDPRCVAAHIERRTSLPPESILAMLDPEAAGKR